MSPITYKDTGVDLDLYEQSMEKIPALLRRTHSNRVIDLAGGFAGLFRLENRDGTPAKRYRDPVLVSGTDGVGTKLKVAMKAGRYDSVGIDLVAMCVNDCLCVGAEPLFFLDYLAFGKDDPELVGELVRGVSEGCVQAESALLGGETAIMPDLYAPGDFDMAGFSVGVVERSRLIDGRAITPGDKVIGLASSGFHSNGYSLLRKAVFEGAGLDLDHRISGLEKSVEDLLLEPTRIYVRALRDVLQSGRGKPVVHGMAHITGGGLADNIERILPEGCRISIDSSDWTPHPAFTWLESLGQIERDEMFRVFNMGIGYVLIVGPRQVAAVRKQVEAAGVQTWIIGRVAEGERGVEVRHSSSKKSRSATSDTAKTLF